MIAGMSRGRPPGNQLLLVADKWSALIQPIALFFFSGGASLILEVVWLQMLEQGNHAFTRLRRYLLFLVVSISAMLSELKA